MSFTKKYEGALQHAGYDPSGKDRPLNYDFLKTLCHKPTQGDLMSILKEADEARRKSTHHWDEEGAVEDTDIMKLKSALELLRRQYEEEPTSGGECDTGVRNRKNKRPESNATSRYTGNLRSHALEEDREITDISLKRAVFAYAVRREAKRINERYLSELNKIKSSIVSCAEIARKQGFKHEELGAISKSPSLSIMPTSSSSNSFTGLAARAGARISSVNLTIDETDNTDHDQLESPQEAADSGNSSSDVNVTDATSIRSRPIAEPDSVMKSSYDFSSDEELPPMSVDPSKTRRQSTPRRRSTKSRVKRRSVKDSLFEVAVAPRTMYSLLVNKDIDKERKNITMASMKNALQVAYDRVSELKALRILNYTALIKALKKWDKVNTKGSGDNLDSDVYVHVENAYPSLMPDNEICTVGYEKPLQKEIGRIYASLFCGGDLVEAKGKLTLAKGDAPKRQYDLSIGFILGILLSLTTFVIYDLATAGVSKLHTLWIDPSMYIIITVLGILLYRWMWHLHVHLWSEAGINFRSLLMLPAKLLPDPMKAVQKILFNTLIVMLCFSALVLSIRVDGPVIYHRAWSILLWCLAMAHSVYTYFGEDDTQGVFSLSTVVNCLSPMAPCDAKDRFAMDIATSLTVVMLSLVYSSCFIFNGIIVEDEVTMENMGLCDPSRNTAVLVWSFLLIVFPFFIRLCQCMRRHYDSGSKDIFMWPHGVNSCKYGLSILVVCLGFFYRINISSRVLDIVVYAVVSSLATLLASYFDVHGDWGLASIPLRSSSNNAASTASFWQRGVFLRQDLMYSNKAFYYFVLTLNPLLRCMWTVSILNVGSSSEQGLRVFTFFGFTLEILRRFLWGLLKMEFDHITASSKYEDALLKPLLKTTKDSCEEGEDQEENIPKRVLTLHFETDYYDIGSEEKNIAVPLSLLGIITFTIISILIIVGTVQ